MNKKVTILVVLAIVAVGAVFLYTQQKKAGVAPTVTKETNQPEKQIVKKEVEKNKVPEKFPTDIPIEKGAKITQNYNATAPDGRFQATRVFETQQTLADNLTLYKEYLAKAGYKLQSTVDQPTYKMVSGTKGNASLQVSIDENSQFKTKTVNISYTETANAPAAK